MARPIRGSFLKLKHKVIILMTGVTTQSFVPMDQSEIFAQEALDENYNYEEEASREESITKANSRVELKINISSAQVILSGFSGRERSEEQLCSPGRGLEENNYSHLGIHYLLSNKTDLSIDFFFFIIRKIVWLGENWHI